MTQLLLLLPSTLPQQADATYEFVVSADGRTVAQHGRSKLRDWAQRRHTLQTVTAMVPRGMLSWHRVQLPPGTLPARLLKNKHHNRLRAVLEGLLEDQLLDDPAQLHFSLQPDARTDGPVWVAVCDKQWLHQSLAVLEQAGISPDRVVPEMAPPTPPAISRRATQRQPRLWAVGTPEHAHWLWSDHNGVHQLPLVSPEHISEHRHGIGPDQAQLLAEPAVAHWAEQTLQRPATITPGSQRLLDATRGRWNLVQGTQAGRPPSWGHLLHNPSWRPARQVLLGCIAVHLAGVVLVGWQAQSELDDKRLALVKTVRSNFPQITIPIQPRNQMERAVQELRRASGQSGPGDMEQLLAQLANNRAWQDSGLQAQKLAYAPGELRLQATGLPPTIDTQLNAAWEQPYWLSRVDNNTLVIQTRRTP